MLMKKQREKIEYERCVLCGEETPVPAAMPVQWREDYELGCGQLCIACKKLLGKNQQQENGLARQRIMRQQNKTKLK